MMIKSVLYLSMYSVIAGGGWFFYDSLGKNEQPIAQLQESYKEIKTSFQSDKPATGIYRWKNEDGGWEYGNKLPEHLRENVTQAQQDYQKELALLKSLPEGVLPISNQRLEQEMSVKSTNDSFIIPGIPSLEQVSKLLHDATDIQAKMDNRKDKIDQALQGQ
ncbi:MAG: hypothetical protein OEX19_17585 [Gammaproteobacteria bacterium]|nr:hypothetical protein [Gammaproteobacteria bacterium]